MNIGSPWNGLPLYEWLSHLIVSIIHIFNELPLSNKFIPVRNEPKDTWKMEDLMGKPIENRIPQWIPNGSNSSHPKKDLCFKAFTLGLHRFSCEGPVDVDRFFPRSYVARNGI